MFCSYANLVIVIVVVLFVFYCRVLVLVLFQVQDQILVPVLVLIPVLSLALVLVPLLVLVIVLMMDRIKRICSKIYFCNFLRYIEAGHVIISIGQNGLCINRNLIQIVESRRCEA